MNNTVFMIMVIICFLGAAFTIMGLFAAGFLIGYKREDFKAQKIAQRDIKKFVAESEEEKRAKKEWMKFLKYDGSTPTGLE